MNRTIKSLELSLKALDLNRHAITDKILNSNGQNVEQLNEELQDSIQAYQDISDLLVHYKQIVSR